MRDWPPIHDPHVLEWLSLEDEAWHAVLKQRLRGSLFASPGTAVCASVLWLTPPQLAELTIAELGYRLGRLDRAHFVMDEAGVTVDDLFAYISRIGALRLDGEPVALKAIPPRAGGRAR